MNFTKSYYSTWILSPCITDSWVGQPQPRVSDVSLQRHPPHRDYWRHNSRVSGDRDQTGCPCKSEHRWKPTSLPQPAFPFSPRTPGEPEQPGGHVTHPKAPVWSWATRQLTPKRAMLYSHPPAGPHVSNTSRIDRTGQSRVSSSYSSSSFHVLLLFFTSQIIWRQWASNELYAAARGHGLIHTEWRGPG